MIFFSAWAGKFVLISCTRFSLIVGQKKLRLTGEFFFEFCELFRKHELQTSKPFKCNSKSVVRGQMWVLYVCVSSYFSLVNQDSSQLVRIWQRDDGNVIFTGGVKVSRQVNHQLDPEENTTLIITDAQVSWDIKFPADYTHLIKFQIEIICLSEIAFF